MARSVERQGANVFDAASAPLRMQVLRLLSTKGALPYTEIMSALKLEPVRDSGKFVYHLRSLMEPGLIVLDKRTKTYETTELGEMVVHFARDLEEYVSLKRGRLFVRTSRLAIEDFRRNKIAKALVMEAGVPQELADEIAAEAEDRLMKLRTSYLSSALIREFVNSLLIEKRLLEYRHKLARLGMPVYDVTQLLRETGERGLASDYVQKAAGASVLGEYVLLESLPREIADAHIAGRIHIADIESWPLRPSEVQHDLRYFLRNGMTGFGHPESFDSALLMIQNIYRLGLAEISGEQSFDLFNVFLAPFVKGVPLESIRESLELFLAAVGQDFPTVAGQPGLALGIEYSVPPFLENVEAIGPGGKPMGVYGDYHEEVGRVVDSIHAATTKQAATRPLFNPRLVFKLRDSVAQSNQFHARILKTHELAALRTLPYFALLRDGDSECYTASGLRLSDEWSNQWESDCYRAGCMATIFLNLPRLAYDAQKDDDRLLSSLADHFNLMVGAFKLKKSLMTDRLRQAILPLLFGSGQSAPYFHEKSSTYAVAPLGLNEACRAHTGSELRRSSLQFADKILQELRKLAASAVGESGMRFVIAERPGDEAASRLAELDVERYGKSVVYEQSGGNYPYYTDLPGVPLSSKMPIEERMSVEASLQAATPGGHLSIVSVEPEIAAETLMDLTRNARRNGIKYLAYSRLYSFCRTCNQTVSRMVPGCPKCASDNITHYGRSSATYIPLELWPEGKRRTMERTVYSITPTNRSGSTSDTHSKTT